MKWIQTYGGRRLSPTNVHTDDLDIQDIARSLSLQCRFTGHCRAFYSVAEHCVRVSNALDAALAPWGLLHDAAEAYVSDLSRALKCEFPQLMEAEKKILQVVAQRYGLVWPMPSEVIKADDSLFAAEVRDLVECGRTGWGIEVPAHPEIIKPWPLGMRRNVFSTSITCSLM